MRKIPKTLELDKKVIEELSKKLYFDTDYIKLVIEEIGKAKAEPITLPSIDDKYNVYSGILGAPITGEKTGEKGGKYKEYEKGSIFWHPNLGAFAIYGDILKKYKLLKAEKGFLGYPTTDVLKGTAGGFYSVFEGGAILWQPNLLTPIDWDEKDAIKAFEVHGAILAKYKQMKSYTSFLGYPITDELVANDGIGRFSMFEHGTIYWSPTTNAHEVHGAILDKYVDCEFLGYPITDELITSDGKGRYNEFEKGVIYWSPGTGAYEVHGEILSKWSSLSPKREKSKMGYPISDEFTVPGTNVKRSIFVGGAIDYIPGEGTKLIQHCQDLKALDWCYKIGTYEKAGKTYNNITFHPVVANIGTQTIKGPIKLYFSFAETYGLIHATGPGGYIDQKWELEPGKITFLGGGKTAHFQDDWEYHYLFYIFDVCGEKPTLLADLESGDSNNGIATFIDNAIKPFCGGTYQGAWVVPPNDSVTGTWIKNQSKREFTKYYWSPSYQATPTK